MTSWRQALSIAPNLVQAQEYVRYVQQNRTALEATFRAYSHPGLPAAGRVAAAAASEPTRTRAERAPELSQSDLAMLQDQLNTLLEGDGPVLDSAPLLPRAEASKAARPASAATPAKHADVSRRSEPTTPPAALADLAASVAPAASPATPNVDPLGFAIQEDEDLTPRVDLEALQAELQREKESRGYLREVRQEGLRRPEFPTPDPPPSMPSGVRRSREGLLRAEMPSPVEALPLPTVPEPEAPLAPRNLMHTPLTLVPGGAEMAVQEFEPDEPTPIGLLIPEVPGQGLRAVSTSDSLDGSDYDLAQEELASEQITPSSLVKNQGSLLGPEVAPEPAADVAAPTRRRAPSSQSTLLGVSPSETPGRRPAPVALSSVPSSSVGLDQLAETADLYQREEPTPAPAEVEERVDSMLAGARQLHEQGTFEGSAWLCQRILEAEPGHRDAEALLERNRQVLLRQYERELGDLEQVPVVQVPQHEIVWHKLDHRAGFLLSRIDGLLSYVDILDISGMSRFEACRILSQLLEQGVIGPRR